MAKKIDLEFVHKQPTCEQIDLLGNEQAAVEEELADKKANKSEIFKQLLVQIKEFQSFPNCTFKICSLSLCFLSLQ